MVSAARAQGRPMMVIAMITAAISQPAAIQNPPNRIHRRFRTRLAGDMAVPILLFLSGGAALAELATAPTRNFSLRLGRNSLLQLHQQGLLIRKDFYHCRCGVEPADAVDLGESLSSPGLWRPFDLEGVAGECVKVEIRFKRPGVHRLPAFLPYRRQPDEVTVRSEVRFFAEFPSCSGKEIGAWFGNAFGDGPHARVLPCPEWSARMGQQDFETVPAAKCQDPGADFCAAT